MEQNKTTKNYFKHGVFKLWSRISPGTAWVPSTLRALSVLKPKSTSCRTMLLKAFFSLRTFSTVRVSEILFFTNLTTVFFFSSSLSVPSVCFNYLHWTSFPVAGCSNLSPWLFPLMSPPPPLIFLSPVISGSRRLLCCYRHLYALIRKDSIISLKELPNLTIDFTVIRPVYPVKSKCQVMTA